MMRVATVGDGRYTLTERVAVGGMGEVWRAVDSVLDRDVAVKLLKGEYAEDPAFRARLAAEARTAAGLSHPGIAQVFDYGEAPRDDQWGHTLSYLVMEMVPGEPLSAVLAREGALSPEQAADVVAQAGEAIDAAHRRGVVHRDVKPANLLLTPDGRVKVTDFGIARAADAVPLTETGQVIGTPHYLSPEQARGERATPASDVYALGVVLYECLAGRRPFEGAPVAVATSHLLEPVPALPEWVPPDLAAVCMRALSKDPAERMATAAGLAAQLRRREPVTVRATPPVTAPPPTRRMPTTTLLPSPDRSRRRVWASTVLTVGVVMALVAMLASALSGDGSGAEPAEQPPQAPVSAGPAEGRHPADESDGAGVGTGSAPEEGSGGVPAPERSAGAPQGHGEPGDGGRPDDKGRSQDMSDDKGKSDDKGRSEGEETSGSADDDGED